MDNLYFYNLGREVPEEAKKPISAGRLKGMTDINPMWRIKRLTEMFGACGVGWWYEITDKQIIYDDITKQAMATVDILLYYLDPFSGHSSYGIPGTGGASFVAKETKGAYMSDECYKMALTDAISVAAKALGIGADIYFAKDRTKYNGEESDDIKSDDVKMETLEEAAGYVLGFGKYRGQTLGDVYKTDGQYTEWLYNGESTDPVIKKAIGILLQAVKDSRNGKGVAQNG